MSRNLREMKTYVAYSFKKSISNALQGHPWLSETHWYFSELQICQCLKNVQESGNAAPTYVTYVEGNVLLICNVNPVRSLDTTKGFPF